MVFGILSLTALSSERFVIRDLFRGMMIDISMLREDYDKFREGFDTWEYAPHLELLDYRQDSDVMFPFFKICDNRTEMQMARNSKRSMGINIDVFPLDGIPGGKRRAHLFIRLCYFLKQCQSLANREQWYCNKMTVFEMLIRAVFRVLTFGASVSLFCRLQQWVASHYEGKKCLWTANHMWRASMKAGPDRDCIPTSAYESDVELYSMVASPPCISGYDVSFRRRCGDYMPPPSARERTNVRLFRDGGDEMIIH